MLPGIIIVIVIMLHSSGRNNHMLRKSTYLFTTLEVTFCFQTTLIIVSNMSVFTFAHFCIWQLVSNFLKMPLLLSVRTST